jgi:cell division protein FtsB
MPDPFDWEQEGYKRLHHLEAENADLRRENARLREQIRELEWNQRPSCRPPNRAQAVADRAWVQTSRGS